MPGYLTLIFLCQFLGELAAGALALPVPGPVLGMVMLFAFLMIRGEVPESLGQSSGALLKAMSLLFVPAGAGVMMHFHLLESAALPLLAGLLVSTVATIVVTAWIMARLGKGEA